jgi:hypothetical protein
MVVKSGMVCVSKCAYGPYEYKVLRQHRDSGYWETMITSGIHRYSLQVVSARKILSQVKVED